MPERHPTGSPISQKALVSRMISRIPGEMPSLEYMVAPDGSEWSTDRDAAYIFADYLVADQLARDLRTAHPEWGFLVACVLAGEPEVLPAAVNFSRARPAARKARRAVISAPEDTWRHHCPNCGIE